MSEFDIQNSANIDGKKRSILDLIFVGESDVSCPPGYR